MIRSGALALTMIAAAFVSPALAQDVFGGTQSFYIDGNRPVDQRTRDLVDAYVIHKEIRDREEAERREKLELFINNDLISSGMPYGRY